MTDTDEVFSKEAPHRENPLVELKLLELWEILNVPAISADCNSPIVRGIRWEKFWRDPNYQKEGV